MAKRSPPFSDPNVRSVFEAYPPKLRKDLLQLRGLIFETASGLEPVDLVETLKWGQPAYLPAKPRTGSTVRIDALKNDPSRYGMFFHCQTTLVDIYGRKSFEHSDENELSPHYIIPSVFDRRVAQAVASAVADAALDGGQARRQNKPAS